MTKNEEIRKNIIEKLYFETRNKKENIRLKDVSASLNISWPDATTQSKYLTDEGYNQINCTPGMACTYYSTPEKTCA